MLLLLQWTMGIWENKMLQLILGSLWKRKAEEGPLRKAGEVSPEEQLEALQ